MPGKSSEQQRLAVELLSLLVVRAEDGSYRYSAAELRNFVPYLLLLLFQKRGAARTPPQVLRYLEEFGARIQVSAPADLSAWKTALAAHYRAHPINPHLLRSFHRFLAKQKARLAEKDLGRALRQLLKRGAVNPLSPGVALRRPLTKK